MTACFDNSSSVRLSTILLKAEDDIKNNWNNSFENQNEQNCRDEIIIEAVKEALESKPDTRNTLSSLYTRSTYHFTDCNTGYRSY